MKPNMPGVKGSSASAKYTKGQRGMEEDVSLELTFVALLVSANDAGVSLKDSLSQGQDVVDEVNVAL